MKNGLIIDCFAGGGGASVGIEMALGRQVDIAVNHDPDAIFLSGIGCPEASSGPHCCISSTFSMIITSGRIVRACLYTAHGRIRRPCLRGFPPLALLWLVQSGLAGGLKPWEPIYKYLDLTDMGKSIFGRKKPLAEKTMNRIARGLERFVFSNPEPFIVQVNHGGDRFRGQSIHEAMPTITQKHGFGIVTADVAPFIAVTPYLIQYHSETTKNGFRGHFCSISSVCSVMSLSIFLSKSSADTTYMLTCPKCPGDVVIV